MIVVLQAGLLLLVEHIGSRLGATVTPGREFVLFVLAMAMLVVVQILSLGFMATVPRYGVRPCEPVLLLRIGRYFFWRLIRFQLLMLIFMLAVLSLLLNFMGYLLGVQEAAEFPTWALSMGQLLTLMLLSKPLVLIPAVMIACDRMVLESLVYLRRYSVRRLVPVLVPFVAFLAVIGGLDFVSSRVGSNGPGRWIVLAASAVVGSIGAFAVGLRAVLFVAERELPRPGEASGPTDAGPESGG